MNLGSPQRYPTDNSRGKEKVIYQRGADSLTPRTTYDNHHQTFMRHKARATFTHEGPQGTDKPKAELGLFSLH